jgi:hypothetical protein
VNRSRARWIVGLLSACFGVGSALMLAACPDPLADCLNTATCPPPPKCDDDAGDAQDDACVDSGISE